MKGESEQGTPRKRNLASQSLARFLLFSMVVMAFFASLNFYLNLIPIALIQSAVLLTLPFLYAWLKKGAPHGIIKHLIGFDLLFVFVPLLFIVTADGTGVYWIFGYPLIAFFFLGTVTGLQWSIAYCLILLGCVGLSQAGLLTLYYTWLQTGLAFVEIIVFIAIGYLFVSDRERAEDLHLSHLNYLESLERIDRALHAYLDLEKCMNGALQRLLEIFGCSRAWLLFPADPDTPTYNVPFERTHPDYPGLFAAGQEVETDYAMRELFHKSLEHHHPIIEITSNHPGGGIDAQYSIRSRMVIALNRELNQSWLLGLHQCDYERQWSTEEQRLFQDIAKRMEDALNQILLYRELVTSESNLRAAIQKAEAANHAKSEFLSTMSHELRTPLHGIIGLQELIAADSGNLSQEQRENLILAQQSAKSLRALVGDVLDLAKIESGSMELVRDSFPLFDCIRDALIPFIIKARQKGISLELSMEEIPATVFGDESRLRQVLLNLIGNAVKFTDKGKVSVKVTNGNRMLYFSISDTGIGIPEDRLDSIFDPFVQINQKGSVAHRGTGLGTSIVKRFVDLMEGSIEVSSQVGQGSCFTFQIPCTPVGDETITVDIDACNDDLNISDATPISTPHLPSGRIRALLAEDDPIGQRIATRQLERAGIEVDAVNSGNEALERISATHYDLLLTDIRMPDISGIDLTRKIRQQEQQNEVARLPIIGLSAHALDEVAKECVEAGMDHFLTKPVDSATILQAISLTTGNSSSKQANSQSIGSG